MTTNDNLPIDISNDEPGFDAHPEQVDEEESGKKAAKRQTAFYPNVNSTNKTSKPFSRSAAKRQSVMALGSIEHLQHYFTKTGLAAKQKPQSRGLVVPAIGGLEYIQTSPTGEVTKLLEDTQPMLPPTPMNPAIPHPSYKDMLKTYETDPEQLKPGVVRDLKAVVEAWKISEEAVGESHVDVLSLLRLTTRAIRSVRNYIVSLPDESGHFLRPQPQFRPNTLRPQLPNKTSSSSMASAANATVTLTSQSDTLAPIRRLALSVLQELHTLEESARLPLSDDAYDIQSDHGSTSSRSLAPSHERQESSPPLSDEDLESNASFAFSVVKVPGRSEHIRVWSNEDDELLLDSDDNETNEKGRWDERLVIGSGWLYRQDISLDTLSRQREVVAKYLDAVDTSLFGGKSGTGDGKRGWDSVKLKLDTKRRRGSSGGESWEASNDGLVASMDKLQVGEGMLGAGLNQLQEEEEEDDDNHTISEIPDSELPEWARRTSLKFSSDPLARAHALLVHLLPSSLLHLLPLPEDPPSPITPTPNSVSTIPRIAFLQALSSGQLLCVAYNAGVRRSRKQWGFVNPENVHDVVSMEAKQAGRDVVGGGAKDEEDRKVGLTFRRIDNLRLWIAALKLRYSITSISPNSTATNQTVSRNPAEPPPIVFEARSVARREEGWDNMLQNVLVRWVEDVVKEKRGEM